MMRLEFTVLNIPLTPHVIWPYVIGLLAAICFGFMKFKIDQTWSLWAIGGGIFGLVTATIISGLANAVAVPNTDAVRNKDQLVGLVIAVIIIATVGFLLQASRHKEEPPGGSVIQ